MSNRWDNELKQKMEGFEMDSPDGLWESIETAVSANLRKKSVPPLLRYALWTAAAAVIAGMFLLTFWGQHRSDAPAGDFDRVAKVDVQVGRTEELTEEKTYGQTGGLAKDGTELLAYSGDTNIPEDENVGIGNAGISDKDRTTACNDVKVAGISEEVDNGTKVTDDSNDTDNGPKDTAGYEGLYDDIGDTAAQEESGNSSDRIVTDMDFDEMEDTAGRTDEDRFCGDLSGKNRTKGDKIRIGKVSGSVSLSGAAGNNSSHTGYSESMTAKSTSASFKFGKDPMADIATYNQNKEINTEYSHFQPVRIGMTAMYSVGRFAAETGLTYSCLLSKTRSGSDSYYYTGRQQLHYIGIPLNFSFSILDKKKFRLYVSAGGTMEKCLGGSLTTEYMYNGAAGNPQNEKLVIKQLQWSVQAAAGVQYNFSRIIGLYLEPGATYRFNNGSDIRSVYTDKPFNFSIAVGIRFSILQGSASL